jgi:hypothetical protein
MEAQRENRVNYPHQNLINYNYLNHLNNLDSDYQKKKITKQQISKLALKEAQNCYVDLDGIDDYNKTYQNTMAKS